MKIIDEREKQQKAKTERNKDLRQAIVKVWEPNEKVNKWAKFSSNKNQLKETSDVYYFKLLDISNLSRHIKNKI